jgi:hypothetical protein
MMTYYQWRNLLADATMEVAHIYTTVQQTRVATPDQERQLRFLTNVCTVAGNMLSLVHQEEHWEGEERSLEFAHMHLDYFLQETGDEDPNLHEARHVLQRRIKKGGGQ